MNTILRAARPGTRGLVLALVLIATLIASAARAEVVNRIAAVVDDEVITVYEVERESRPVVSAYLSSSEGATPEERAAAVAQIKRDVMQRLIENVLLEREVARLGFPVEEQDVDKYVERIMAANRMDRDQLVEMLAREGKTMDDLRDQVRKQILRERYVGFRMKDRIAVSEEEARTYYQNNPDEFIDDSRITLAEIRFNIPPDATQDDIRAVFERAASTYESLVAGADFAETARTASDGPTAKNGGLLGTFLLSKELKSTYQRAAEPLEQGKLSTVFRDTLGFFILKCLDRQVSGQRPFEDVREQIELKLRREASEREMRKLAQELYKKSYVDIKVKDFTEQP